MLCEAWVDLAIVIIMFVFMYNALI